MVGEPRIPAGSSLLLIGSGLYWILSSQLISSFTVLTPGLFQTNPLGGSLITVVGIISAIMGLWIVQVDLDEFRVLVGGAMDGSSRFHSHSPPATCSSH